MTEEEYQEDVKHDIHGLGEESDPVVVLCRFAPCNRIVVREERHFEEVSIDDPVLREAIDDAVVLRCSREFERTSTMRTRK